MRLITINGRIGAGICQAGRVSLLTFTVVYITVIWQPCLQLSVLQHMQQARAIMPFVKLCAVVCMPQLHAAGAFMIALAAQ